MSVNYSAKYGRGYMVDWSEVEQLDDETHDEFLDSEYTNWICGYSDNSPIFFGIVAVSIDCDETGYYELDPSDGEFSHSQMIDMIKEFKKFFPNRGNYCLHNYIMGCVT